MNSEHDEDTLEPAPAQKAALLENIDADLEARAYGHLGFETGRFVRQASWGVDWREDRKGEGIRGELCVYGFCFRGSWNRSNGAAEAELFVGLMGEFGVAAPSSQCRAMILQEAATNDISFGAMLDEILEEGNQVASEDSSFRRSITATFAGLGAAKAFTWGGILAGNAIFKGLSSILINEAYRPKRDWQIWANNGSNPPEKVAKGLHPGSYHR